MEEPIVTLSDMLDSRLDQDCENGVLVIINAVNHNFWV